MNVIYAVVVHHRGREMLEECLESLLASEQIDLQIVVVLNGCEEALPDVVEDSERVHVVAAPKPIGFSAANNLGVAWAEEHLGACQSYYFVNNDTVSGSDALALLAAALEDGAGVAGPQLLIQWAPDHLNSLGLNVTEDGWGWDEGIGVALADYGPLPSHNEVLAVTGSALLIRREIFREIGGWTELYDYYFEDIDLCLKVRRAGWTVVNEPAAVVYHAVSATSGLDSEWKVFLFWRNRLLLAMLHWPAGLLLRHLVPIVLIDEIVKRPWRHSGLQRKALMGALRRIPRIVRLRLGLRGSDRSWVEMLKPPGSVPEIVLPEMQTEGEGDPIIETARRSEKDRRSEAMESRERGTRSLSRLLVLGVCPLPFESTIRSFGPGTRTWQLVEPLLDDGHEVALVALRIPDTYPPDTPPEVIHSEGLFNYASVTHEVFAQTDYVKNLYRNMNPDAVIFAHGSASYLKHLLEPDVPIWIDLCGHVMAEAQAKAAVYGDDSYVNYFFERSVGALFHGDHFSTVSEAQKYALIGELGLAGRLNAATDGHELVSVIPCGAEEDDYVHKTTVFRGIDVDDEAFVVLWSGGFNTWTDVDTMFAGLEYAMNEDSSVVFVATGGQIDGHDEKTYPRFVEMIEASQFRDRFILKGWIDRDSVPSTYFEADVGINCEKDIYEVRMGSKHRILDWSRAALPVVSTRVTELSMAIEEEGVGFICRAGDGEALGRAILDAVARRKDLPEMGRKCRSTLRRLYGFHESTIELRRWARHPTFAPDWNRTPLCLQRLLEGSGESVLPETNQISGAVEGDFSEEGRLQWLKRVVKKSHEDGGLSMILKRALNRIGPQ
jgi:GT2 family glycosyltransferase/glycosyltransferase involved in cell wall biosynthesis